MGLFQVFTIPIAITLNVMNKLCMLNQHRQFKCDSIFIHISSELPNFTLIYCLITYDANASMVQYTTTINVHGNKLGHT